MSSLGRSGKKTLAALTLCELVAYGIRQCYAGRTRAKTALALADALEKRCDEAARACGLRSAIDAKDIDRISRRMKRFERDYIARPAVTLTLCTSLALGALDEPLSTITDPRKRNALEKVESAVRRIHMYYDRHMDRWDEYEEATRLLQHYDAVVCA